MYGLGRHQKVLKTASRTDRHSLTSKNSKATVQPLVQNLQLPAPSFNSKKSNASLKSPNKDQMPQDPPASLSSEEHEAQVQKIQSSWEALMKQMNESKETREQLTWTIEGRKSSRGKEKPENLPIPRVAIFEDEENEDLKDFKPFDLNAFWVDRIIADLIKDT